MMRKFLQLFILSVVLFTTYGRKHHLSLENDIRPWIHISSFGFYKGGFLEVKLSEMRIEPQAAIQGDYLLAFSIYRTLNNGINPYSHNVDNPCSNSMDVENEGFSTILLEFDLKTPRIKVQCSPALRSNVKIYRTTNGIPLPISNWNLISPHGIITQTRKRRYVISSDSPEKVVDPAYKQGEEAATSATDGKMMQQPSPDDPNNNSKNKNPSFSKKGYDRNIYSDTGQCDGSILPLNSTTINGDTTYSATFVMYIAGEDCEGLYNLYFRNCVPAYPFVSLSMEITEENPGRNFLSAGEMPLPALYFMMSVLFFASGCFWVFILRKSKKEVGVTVFKIHYLMGVLVFLKSISLFFHSINYHYIQIKGTHVESWAILFYIAHLLKGALMFTTILLIGTGYAFIKHLLSDKDKKIFMFVIPLQILANVAQIILEESEEGDVVHRFWRIVFIILDLLCCGAILFPVVWSIKHLQEASHVDGKAASNIRKLKLFRHFYIIIVCYIYFTRVIVNMLLKMTVPFQYEWITNVFLEATTFIFFILTGYKFRPAKNNPYLQLGHDSDSEDNDIALTQNALVECVSKRGPKSKKKTLKEIVLYDENDSNDDEEVLLEKITVKEDSLDYD